jgi:hypothetical protein
LDQGISCFFLFSPDIFITKLFQQVHEFMNVPSAFLERKHPERWAKREPVPPDDDGPKDEVVVIG